MQDNGLRKIAFVADYVPRQCGIATFTENLRNAVANRLPAAECLVLPVSDIATGYDYPAEARFEFDQDQLASYRRAADFLNLSDVDVVSLQHEYGIFGGPAGGHILALVRDLAMPVVTTLHTILEEPNSDQRRVLKQLAELSARVIVMTERGRRILQNVYGVRTETIEVIPHGIPDVPFVDPNFYKDKFGVDGKFVALTFGLLSPNKGIEYVLRALPRVIREFPNLVYIVLGATHPNLVRDQGESYRLGLARLARELGIEEHVIFRDQFVELDQLLEFLGAADVYITPYLNPAQITSGTLAYAFGAGKAVISTPYWHAEELLGEGRGVLVPFADAEAIASELLSLMRDKPRRHAMRKQAYLLGRDMIWPRVADRYLETFGRARRARADFRAALPARTTGAKPRELPPLRFDHLLRMTDATGLLQHARFRVPAYREGYCTDDNARALLLSVRLEQLGLDTPDVRRAQASYAAFLDYAFAPETGRFRNFLGYDRVWREADGSDDCLGRAVWALGTILGRSDDRPLRQWAAPLFEQSVGATVETTSPRAWAAALAGICEYLSQLPGDRRVARIRDVLTDKLLGLFERTATGSWLWFEDVVAYDNARLPQALLLSGRTSGNRAALDAGLASLRWLTEAQTSPRGFFQPIGSDGFWRRGAERADFDQQPLEAAASVAACIEAYDATGDRSWIACAHSAYDWFLGHNALAIPLYDSASGGCRDGLRSDRVNQNQGAESTLSFLLASTDVRLLGHVRSGWAEVPAVAAGVAMPAGAAAGVIGLDVRRDSIAADPRVIHPAGREQAAPRRSLPAADCR